MSGTSVRKFTVVVFLMIFLCALGMVRIIEDTLVVMWGTCKRHGEHEHGNHYLDCGR